VLHFYSGKLLQIHSGVDNQTAVNTLSRMGEALRDPENELLRLVTEVEAQLEPQLQET
jgi:hypothetical protein